jgi:negative regulator of genetic competence, sporulation and motility
MDKKVNSPEIKAFIRRHNSLFWYTPEDKKEDISEEFLVETILNYGDLKDINELINIMGINNVATTFFKTEGRKKLNYYPEIYNFFNLVFNKYVPNHSK